MVQPEDLTVVEEPLGNFVVESDEGFTVALDPAVDDELRREGVARELVSRLQRLRKDAGLAVSDRIRAGIFGPEEVQEAARTHEAYIAGETLALALDLGSAAQDGAFQAMQDIDLDGANVRIGLSKA